MLSHLESFYIIVPGLWDPPCMKQWRRRNPGLSARGRVFNGKAGEINFNACSARP